jgi:hypothetical protein
VLAFLPLLFELSLAVAFLAISFSWVGRFNAQLMAAGAYPAFETMMMMQGKGRAASARPSGAT